jgi:SpoVK/Ycf46/Vps4 family AAA+-type ATPase
LSERQRFDLDLIIETKAQTIKKTGFMEYWEPERMEDVGGLGEFKDWLRTVEPAFANPDGPLPQPKAVLQVGVAGAGKSLSSKATASFLRRPLIRLDVNAVKSSGVGDSEKNLRTVARTLEAFGECVCWLDEVEKMFAGGASTASAASDAGTSVAMFGFWLTFMQETKAPILFMATANDVSALPSAFLRRFDEIFFVDLPTTEERAEIITIMNRKYNANLPGSFADELVGYTGAEIEKVAKASLFHGPERAARRVTPVSRMAKEEIDAVRNWAKAKGAQLANTVEKPTGIIRRIRKGD